MRRQWRRRGGPRSLGRRLVVLLSAAGVTGALAITLLLAAIITPNFDTLEARGLIRDIDRLRTGIATVAADVEHVAHDLAVRSGRIRLAPGESMARIAADGRLSAQAGDAAGRATLAELRRNRSRPAWRDERTVASGFAVSGGRLVAIGMARPRPQGPAILMVRPVDPERWASPIGATVRLLPAGPGTGAGAGAGAGALDWSWRTVGVPLPLTGPDGRTVAVARFDLPRDMAILGRRMLLLSAAGATLLLLGLLLVLRRAIARHVLDPLARVERHMQHVRASSMLTPLDDDGRRDEIGALTTSLNAMLGQLRDLYERIEAQGFALGRSESAVAVMHNVRNALNPVSTILSRSAGERRGASRATLDRAVAELALPDLPAERRQRLVDFVAAALEADARDRNRIAADAVAGREALAHVLEVIGAQQARAHERPPLEPCDIVELAARQASIVHYAPSASIALSLPAGPVMVRGNRLLLSQLLANLIANAVDAIVAGGTGSGRISVTAGGDAARVTITIRDDGVGFAPGSEVTLFRRGYSTKPGRRGGLGLHWCANALAAMEGTLDLRSAGQGLGAEAVLTLPRS